MSKESARLHISTSSTGKSGCTSHVHFNRLTRLRELQAPVWGYPTEGAYYRDASSIDSIFAIKTPFFVIQAEDDPVRLNQISHLFIVTLH